MNSNNRLRRLPLIASKSRHNWRKSGPIDSNSKQTPNSRHRPRKGDRSLPAKIYLLAADLLNQLKARHPKSKLTYAEAEAIVEIIDEF